MCIFMEKKISLIVPAYNEEKLIASSIEKILSYMKSKGHNFELLVIDDGSKDTTAEKVKSITDDSLNLISYSPNGGKGYAVKQGMLAATGDFLVFLDADLATPIEELEKFLPLTDRFDVLIASRALRDSDVQIHQALYRELLGKIFNKIVQLLAVWGVKDTQCGFKLFSSKAADVIFKRQLIHGWAFDVELLFIARKHGFSIMEIPVTWINEENSQVSPLKSSIQMFVEILKINWNNLKGCYK